MSIKFLIIMALTSCLHAITPPESYCWSNVQYKCNTVYHIETDHDMCSAINKTRKALSSTAKQVAKHEKCLQKLCKLMNRLEKEIENHDKIFGVILDELELTN